MKERAHEARVDEYELLAGGALASFETSSAESGILAYIEAFQRFSEALSPFDRQILTEYYCLGKTQEQLAVIHSLSQPTIVRAIQGAVEALGTVISGQTPVRNRRKLLSPLRLHESRWVGQFVVDLSQPDLDHLFSPHATPRCS